MSQIIKASPENLQTNVSLNPSVRIQFDTPLNPETVNEYTVILAESDSEVIVPGLVGYIFGTAEVTFKIFDYLKANTEYTLILVGGVTGILTSLGATAMIDNYVVRFRTGTAIDPNMPLAKQGNYDGTQPFYGNDGIYQQVYERTGEPISHIVTTAGTVGPSGTIIPEGYQWSWDEEAHASGVVPDGSIYLPPPVAPEDLLLTVVSTTPANNASAVSSGVIEITFSEAPDNIVDSHINIEVVNFVDLFTLSAPVFTWEVDGNILTITVSPFENSADYKVTLSQNIASNGFSLGTDYVLNFRSNVFPFYTTVSTIRANLGSLILQIENSEIEFFIYKYSKEINDSFSIGLVPTQPAIDFVMCSTKLALVRRRVFEGGPVSRKKLADLEIEYGRDYVKGIAQFVKDLEECVAYNRDILAGADGSHVRTPIKAANDPRRPSWTRLNGSGF